MPPKRTAKVAPSDRTSVGDSRSSVGDGGEGTSVAVYGRFRPVARGRQPGPIVMHSEKRVQVKEYQFDLNGIFKEIETQEAVYDQAARDNVATVVNGMNSTLMAYGQTGAGKTHAMFGPDEVLTDFSSADPAQYGMIPRALSQIFTKLEAMDGGQQVDSHLLLLRALPR